MIKNFLIAALLCLPCAAFGQSKTFQASNYGSWSSNVYSANATGASSLVVSPTTVNTQTGTQFIPFQISESVTFDKGLATAETITITPSNCYASLGTPTCTLSGTFTYKHTAGSSVSSGTYGLQEAINAAMSNPGIAGMVNIDATWLGPSGSSVITSVIGTTSVVIQDLRSGAPVYYQWNGTAYAAVSSGIGYPGAGIACSTGTAWCASYSAGAFLQSANNLSDVASATTSRTNISAAKLGANSDITSLSPGAGGLPIFGSGTASITLGVGGASGPSLAAAAGAPTGCGSTLAVGSQYYNSTATTPANSIYNCAGGAVSANVGTFNLGQLNVSNVVGGTMVTGETFNTPITLAAAATVNSCSFYIGHYANGSSHHYGCGITAAPTGTTQSTTLACYAAQAEFTGPINEFVTIPLTGCGTLSAGNYWVISFTDDGGYVSLGTSNCNGTCASPGYYGTSTWTYGGAPVITTTALTEYTSGLNFVQGINVTPTGTPYITTVPAGLDVSSLGQVTGIQGIPYASLGVGPLGLDANGNPRIMPAIDATFGSTGAFGNSTNYTTGSQLAAITPKNAGTITNITIVNQTLAAGSCTTAPTFNVFVGSSSSEGTAIIASAAKQAALGTVTSQAQTLSFGAGQVIGLYVSTQGATCLAPVFSVTVSYTEQ
jgi:hypothetical protein